MSKRKKIVFDENTKIISVSSATEPNNNFKAFLENNKIYFETILAIILTIAGIIVSVAGVKVSMVANDIEKEKNEIEDLEKQPTFVFESETDEKEIKYIIKNTGGDIKYGNVFVDEALIVSIYDSDYDYLGNGYVILGGYIDNGFSEYDFDTNSFTVSTELGPKPIFELSEKIEQIIRDEGYYCGIISTKYFSFLYQNYKQEMISKDMILRNGIICDIDNSEEYFFKTYISSNESDDEQLKARIKAEIGLLEYYNRR